jgi:hypothetical protein
MPPAVPNRLFTLDSPNIDDFQQLCSYYFPKRLLYKTKSR